MKRKNMTKFDKAVSAAFTGHRFYNFSQQEVIRERLTKAILEAYEHGISNFISGFAIGIDLMAAQIVQSLKPSCPGMTLTAAIPFRGQADRFKPSDRMVYECIPSPHYPHLIPLYEEIYLHKDRTYWKQLEQETAKMAQEAQCKYVDNKKYAHSPKEFYSRASSSIGYK